MPKPESDRVYVLGIDGGLATVGLCVAELSVGYAIHVQHLAVLTTAKDKGPKIPKAERERLAREKKDAANARSREQARRKRAGEPALLPSPPPLTGTTGGFPAEGTAARVRAHVRGIRAVLRTYPISIICVESLSLPRNASASAKIASTWGAIVALADCEGLPLVQAMPQAVKYAATGNPSADKGGVGSALLRIYADADRLIETVTPASLREHAWDALGVIHACRNEATLIGAWPLL